MSYAQKMNDMLNQPSPMSLLVQTRSTHVDYQWLGGSPSPELLLPRYLLNRIAPSEPAFVLQKKDGIWSLHLFGIPTSRQDRAETTIRIEAILYGSTEHQDESFRLRDFVAWLLQDWLEMLDAEGALKQEPHVANILNQVFDLDSVERLILSKSDGETKFKAELHSESEALCFNAAEALLKRWRKFDVAASVDNKELTPLPSHMVTGWSAQRASTELARALEALETSDSNVLIAMLNLVGEDEAVGLWEEFGLDDYDKAFILRRGAGRREELKKKRNADDIYGQPRKISQLVRTLPSEIEKHRRTSVEQFQRRETQRRRTRLMALGAMATFLLLGIAVAMSLNSNKACATDHQKETEPEPDAPIQTKDRAEDIQPQPEAPVPSETN